MSEVTTQIVGEKLAGWIRRGFGLEPHDSSWRGATIDLTFKEGAEGKRTGHTLELRLRDGSLYRMKIEERKVDLEVAEVADEEQSLFPEKRQA